MSIIKSYDIKTYKLGNMSGTSVLQKGVRKVANGNNATYSILEK